MADPPCTPEQWIRLPIGLRRRWWSETNYGRNPPNKALWQEMKRAVAALDKDATKSPDDEDDDVI